MALAPSGIVVIVPNLDRGCRQQDSCAYYANYARRMTEGASYIFTAHA